MTAVLYQYELSPFCDKVRRVLRLKGIHYTTEDISILDTLRGRLKELSPAAKLPVLAIEGQRIADSTDIIRYLEQHHPEPRLIPADPKQQALVHFFEDWADEALYFHEMHLRFTLPHNAKRWVAVAAANDNPVMQQIAQRVMPVAMRRTTEAQGLGRKPLPALLRDLDRHFAMLAQWLEGQDWLVGDALTLADIAVAAQVECIVGAAEGQAAMAKTPAVAAWLARVDRATK